MPKWEYRVERMDPVAEAVLSNLGATGWELCAVMPALTDLSGRPGVAYFYFKRQIRA